MPVDGDTVLREIVLPRLEGIKKVPGGYMARCPSHEDREPSLSLSVGAEQPVVLHCHANCDRDTVLAALSLTWADLSRPRDDRDGEAGEWTPAGPATAVYDYRGEDGQLLYQVLRIPQAGGGKTFRQRVPDPTAAKGWRWKLGDTRRVPYRLPELIAAVNAGEVVWVCEGEKDVEALATLDVVATCNSGGAGKWLPAFAEHLREADVVVAADRDDTGRAHARQVAASLDGIANSVCIVEAVAGKDVADHLAAGHKPADMVTTWASQPEPTVELAPDLHEFLAVDDPPRDWVVPDLLERGDRLIWTGFEGLGKSMIGRQIAVAAAAGLHPFRHETYPPKRVLFIDCENSERQGRRRFRNLERVARLKGQRVPDGGMHLIHRPSGIDLTTPDDAAWLLERVTAHRPDLLYIGSFYRLHMADTNDEPAARRVVQILDQARTKVDCALMVEAHSPHGSSGHERSLRPVGSSLLLRWPEYGYGITPNPNAEVGPDDRCREVLVKPWRGARDDVRWPKELIWSVVDGDWPWVDPNVALRPTSWAPDIREDAS
jgi:hypothetical protein